MTYELRWNLFIHSRGQRYDPQRKILFIKNAFHFLARACLNETDEKLQRTIGMK